MSSLGRVLIVEDEPSVVALLEDMVSFLGYTLAVAMTGRDALHAVPEFRPDVVLLDLMLPDTRGDAVLVNLRDSEPHLPVIVVTGNTDTELAKQTLAQGAFDYVRKPFDLTRLGHVLEAAIASRG